MPASISISPELVLAARDCRAWNFEEARKLVARYEKIGFPDSVLFETGYGPSGLAHIGTFGEVARTTMVRHAFRVLTGDQIKTRLLCFSDDMDGMRRIPDNVEDPSILEPHLGKPLSSVPNPFGGKYKSFADHNNAMLQKFLDRFGFDYEFASATKYYRSGKFDEALRRVAERYDSIMEIVLPTLGEERRATYSPFLPISPRTGRVLYCPMKRVDGSSGVITFDDEDGREIELSVTGGNVKLQWKPDFGMRWMALGVDFEMFGKDHAPNMNVYDRICKTLGGRPPEHFVYELFLDEQGEKISKSKGNGLTIEKWLDYAPAESLSYYMHLKPKTAKRLSFDVIPRAVDDYFRSLSSLESSSLEEKLLNPAWHVHSGEPPSVEMPISYSMLLNLAIASNAPNPRVLWGFISRRFPGVSPKTHPELGALVRHALCYRRDFIEPTNRPRIPNKGEREVLEKIAKELRYLEKKLRYLDLHKNGEMIQPVLLDIAREEPRYQDRSRKAPDGGPGVSGAFFKMLYETLLGQEKGPRFGSFAALYGTKRTAELIDSRLNAESQRSSTRASA